MCFLNSMLVTAWLTHCTKLFVLTVAFAYFAWQRVHQPNSYRVGTEKTETKPFLLRQWTRLPKATFSSGLDLRNVKKHSRGQVRKPRWPKVSEPVNVETMKTVCTGESAKLSPAVSVEYWGSQDASINFTLSGGVTRKTMVVELWSRQSFCGYVELTVKASLVGAWQRTSACV